MQSRYSSCSVRVVNLSLSVIACLTIGFFISVLHATPVQASTEEEIETVFGHFAPFADTIYRSRSDISLGGKTLGTELPYLAQVTNLSFVSGTHEIVVDPLEWPGYVFTKTVTIPNPGVSGLTDPAVLVALIGGAGATPLDVFVQPIERAAPAEGVQVRLTHLSPYSVGGDTEYAMCNRDGTPFIGIERIGYGESSDYAIVPSGLYPVYLSSSSAGCADPLTSVLYLVLDEQSVADLYAVGSNEKPLLPNSITVVSANARVLYPQTFLPALFN